MRIFLSYALRFLLYAVIVGAFFGLAYGYRNTYRTRLAPFVESIKEAVMPSPCTQPITYTLGTFDPQFQMSREQFLSAVDRAAQVWDSALNKNLFVYATTSGDLDINLIYDYRQDATAQLQKLGIAIKDDKANYEALKSKYESLHASYLQQRSDLENAVKNYDDHKGIYEQEVAYWNSQGGAPHDQYVKIQNDLAALKAEGERIKQQQTIFNDLVSTLNATVSILNRLASQLNLKVTNYNTIGSSTGDEFDEGQYIEDSDGHRINIYQFSNSNKLTRVLEHELGHALGLEHVDDQKAIMYRLNQSTNEALTAADIAELKRVCSSK